MGNVAAVFYCVAQGARKVQPFRHPLSIQTAYVDTGVREKIGSQVARTSPADCLPGVYRYINIGPCHRELSSLTTPSVER